MTTQRLDDGVSDPNSLSPRLGVEYAFVCDDVPDPYSVGRIEVHETLGAPYRMELELHTDVDADDSLRLVGHDVRAAVRRGAHARFFAGVVERVTVVDRKLPWRVCHVRVVPALCALQNECTSRIFQEKRVPEIIEEVLRPSFDAYGREADFSALAAEDYPRRDYCVQYQESDFGFVHRLMQEEGIGYYLTFPSDGPERMVFFDHNRQLLKVDTLAGGPIRYDDQRGNFLADSEVVFEFDPLRRLTPTGVTVRDHDWTRSNPCVEADRSGTGSGRHRRERYEHGHGRKSSITEDSELVATMAAMVQNTLVPHGAALGLGGFAREVMGSAIAGFTCDDAARQAETRTQLARRDENTATGRSDVIGFGVGHTFSLAGHPLGGVDGEYLITQVIHQSHDQTADRAASFENRFECIPKRVPWRPQRGAQPPRVYGVQTATVTGPPGMDIHTDQHGRIKVKFHWDRTDHSPFENSTCWLRVAQTWAGDGFPGFIFIPRVGMEVVVTFIDGDPDRPIVTGCVHNGRNAPPELLPLRATKSAIRTRSVPHGRGYNELSFEDAAGMERVHIRAQRDLDVVALNDQETYVARDQRNIVGRNQFEEVRGDQMIGIRGSREKLVSTHEQETTNGDYSRTVGGSGFISIGDQFVISVEEGSMLTSVPNAEYVVEAGRRLVLAQSGQNAVSINSEGPGKGVVLNARMAVIHVAEDRIELRVGQSSLVITADKIEANNKVMPVGG